MCVCHWLSSPHVDFRKWNRALPVGFSTNLYYPAAVTGLTSKQMTLSFWCHRADIQADKPSLGISTKPRSSSSSSIDIAGCSMVLNGEWRTRIHLLSSVVRRSPSRDSERDWAVGHHFVRTRALIGATEPASNVNTTDVDTKSYPNGFLKILIHEISF